MVAVRLLPGCPAVYTSLVRRAGSRSPVMSCRILIYVAAFGTAPVCGTRCSIKIPAMSLRSFHDGLAGCTFLSLRTGGTGYIRMMTIRSLPDRIASPTNLTLSACSTRPVPVMSQGRR